MLQTVLLSKRVIFLSCNNQNKSETNGVIEVLFGCHGSSFFNMLSMKIHARDYYIRQ